MTNSFVETKFDIQFQDIEKLKWLPWVGKAYDNLRLGKKLLIVAESHYLPPKIKPWHDAVKNQLFTRDFIWKQINNPNNDMEKILLHLQQTLLDDKPTDEQKFKFWNSISYYNFIQRELASSSNADRPKSEDFAQSWNPYFKLISILNPDYCLFGGVSATYENGKFIETAKTNNYACSDIGIKKEKFISSGVSARKVILTKNGKEIPVLFILHPSGRRNFICSEWKIFIDQQMKNYITWLRGQNSTNA